METFENSRNRAVVQTIQMDTNRGAISNRQPDSQHLFKQHRLMSHLILNENVLKTD